MTDQDRLSIVRERCLTSTTPISWNNSTMRDVIAALTAAEEQVRRVERLHYLFEDPAGDCCAECDQPFPCATRLAIDETGPS
jgi:hypothetical protein